MRKLLCLLLCGGLMACATPSPQTASRPTRAEGTHYHAAGGALLTCNTYDFKTICR